MSLVKQVHVEPKEPLSESKPKAQVEVSANDTWTLNENKSKTQHESGNQKIRSKGNYSEPHS